MKQNHNTINAAAGVASTPWHQNIRGALAAPLDQRAALVKGGERHG